MARKTASRIQKRKEIESAEKAEKGAPAKKKAKARKTTRTTRKKVKAKERKRLVWGVFSGSLKEEARFPYDQRKEAEEKLELLRSKSKRSYFIQPIKEAITEAAPAAKEAAADSEDE